jgi:integrase
MVKVPRRITIPLTYNEIFKFFNSLKSYRDIAITGFMLFCGLRSIEVINLKSDDIGISEGQVLIHGKAGKERIVPLPKDLIAALERYVNLERPKTNSPQLFVVLKGQHRGFPLTHCAVRKIFRYHRKISGITNANAHRFRHTFGADMTRAGISLPMLMKLMGHTDVRITMRYVNLFARDIKDEFNKAIANLHTREIINGTKSEP